MHFLTLPSYRVIIFVVVFIVMSITIVFLFSKSGFTAPRLLNCALFLHCSTCTCSVVVSFSCLETGAATNLFSAFSSFQSIFISHLQSFNFAGAGLLNCVTCLDCSILNCSTLMSFSRLALVLQPRYFLHISQPKQFLFFSFTVLICDVTWMQSQLQFFTNSLELDEWGHFYEKKLSNSKWWRTDNLNFENEKSKYIAPHKIIWIVHWSTSVFS